MRLRQVPRFGRAGKLLLSKSARSKRKGRYAAKKMWRELKLLPLRLFPVPNILLTEHFSILQPTLKYLLKSDMATFFANLCALSWLLGISLFTPVVESAPLKPHDEHAQVLCGSADWGDLIIFFLLNYATHVATVKSFPGNTIGVTLRWAAAALLLPYSGIVRGCAAIAGSRSYSDETQLQHAARAGALCALRRSVEWQPKPGDVLTGCKVSHRTSSRWAALSVTQTPTRDVDQDNFVIHGHIPSEIPHGYVLSKLPEDTDVGPPSSAHKDEIQLARMAVLLKSLVGIVQLLFAVVTLYRTRGEQINRYGYAAYGLTVIPYAVMSLINLVAHCLNPDYPALFIVNSDVTTEGQVAGVQFDGIVGKVEDEDTPNRTVKILEVKQYHGPAGRVILVAFEASIQAVRVEGNLGDPSVASLRSSSSTTLSSPASIRTVTPSIADSTGEYKQCSDLDIRQALKNRIEVPDFGPLKRRTSTSWHNVTAYCVGAIGLIAPYVIIAVLTHFQPGTDSNQSDRVWTMSWLVFGQVFGFLVGCAMQKSEGGGSRVALVITLLILLAGIPAIGGLITAGKMFFNSPNCQLGPDSSIFSVMQQPPPPPP